MQDLIYDPGDDGPDVFVDPDGNEYWPGRREVPDRFVEQFLAHPVDAWRHPEDDDGMEINPAPPAGAEDTDTDTSSDDVTAETTTGDDDTDNTDDTFDAAAFVDEHWQTVAAQIRNGVADGHLDAVEDAERAREDGPREDSVLEAIHDRHDELGEA